MTPARGIAAHSLHNPAMVLPKDVALASDFIFKSPNKGKWNKPHWQATATTMVWFIRELPRSPLLMNRVLKIMTSHQDPATASADSMNLIRAQSGLEASVLSTSPPTSTH